jgi:hypothetical protein
MKRFYSLWALPFLVMLFACGVQPSPSPQPGPTPSPTPDIIDGNLTYKTGLLKNPNGDFGAVYWQPYKRLNGRSLESAPRQYDLSNDGIVTRVRDQGQCGSCWAFAATQTMELGQKANGKDLDLSEQQIVSCDKSMYGCNGGWFPGDFLVKNGQALESAFPYRASDVSCKSGLTSAAKPIRWVKVGASGRNPTNEEIATAIADHHAIWVGVGATNAWGGYKGGVFNKCSGGQINHAVTLVGYDLDKKVWHMKNSWGTQWGDQGYMTLPFGCDGIGEEASYVVFEDQPCTPPAVTLAAQYVVKQASDKIILAAEELKDVTYEWTVDGKVVGTKPSVSVKVDADMEASLKVKNRCGELTVRTLVTIRTAPVNSPKK